MTDQIPMAPGQFYAKRWVLYSALGVPEVKLETWRLSIGGLVENELSLSFEELQRMPQVKLTGDVHCVTTWSIKDVVWEGVAFRKLAELARVKPEAEWVMFHCADGYTTPVPLEDVMTEDSLIAFKMNGSPIRLSKAFLFGLSSLTFTLGRARSGLRRSSSSNGIETDTGKLAAITKGASSHKRNVSKAANECEDHRQ